MPNNVCRRGSEYRLSLLETLQLPCAKRKEEGTTGQHQIATALCGASPNVAIHWAGRARITQELAAESLTTKHLR
jgi:hypothetical protein